MPSGNSTLRLRPFRPNNSSAVFHPRLNDKTRGDSVLDVVFRALGAVEKAVSSIAAVFMFAIMIIVFSDVVMRYAFNRPFSWAYDLISLYLMAGIFFLILSEAYASHAH